MGRGACAVEARIAASWGALTAVAPIFQAALDLPHGGVLCALPALLAVGLLSSVEAFFSLPKGYYGLDGLFLLLAFLALARVKTLESLRYCAPGEWGKRLGWDRIPEVRTLRRKLHWLAEQGQPEPWSAELCRQWMASSPDRPGCFTSTATSGSIMAGKPCCHAIT